MADHVTAGPHPGLTTPTAPAPLPTPAKPLTVAVLAGGPSAEHDVSLSSAASVVKGLRSAGHDPLAITISKERRWQFHGQDLTLTPGGGLLGADVVFPALHGPFGEDGALQGALEMLDVAYVGAGVAASAVCMNKLLFKELMAAASIDQVGYVGVGADELAQAPADVLARLQPLGMPLFVKPARMGSSLGIVKVSQPNAIEDALHQAFVHDHLAIVEAMASGVEVECAVLGAPPAGGGGRGALASTPGQVSFSGDWYDFDTKYRPGGIRLEIPAAISASASARVRELALAVFGLVECQDLARVDFFVDGERVLVNELNTMPGFTPTSVYAKLVEHAGIPYPQLVDHLCRMACERHARRRARRR